MKELASSLDYFSSIDNCEYIKKMMKLEKYVNLYIQSLIMLCGLWRVKLFEFYYNQSSYDSLQVHERRLKWKNREKLEKVFKVQRLH